MSIYKIIKYILMFLPLVSLTVFFDLVEYKIYGEYAWRFLVVLLFLRPIRDIFPEYKIFAKAVTLRKELGIISGCFAIAHVVGYFLSTGLPVMFLFNSIMWDPRGYLGWGMFAFITSLILTGTSNIFSIKKLGKKWKLIQRLSYFMLLFVAIHIALVKEGAMVSSIITMGSYIIVYILAYIYKKV